MGTLPSVDDHLARVLATAHPRIQRDASLSDCVGQVLAADVHAKFPVPPFSNSAVDGFVAHEEDLSGEGPWVLPVAGEIAAGHEAINCPPGYAVRIMTGAPVPPQEGFHIVPVEQTNIPRGPHPLPTEVQIHTADLGRSHIRHAGENVGVGEIVARKGTRIDAGTLAALVATGVRTVDVFARPTVAVVSTGDELVAWPGDIHGAQIPDSNLPMVATLLRESGYANVITMHADDDTRSTEALLERAAEQADIVVTTGGVSAGAYDVVRAITESTPDMWFGHVAQRPGSPQGVGRWSGAAFICLPGNPVAAFVSCALYAIPLLRATAGDNTRCTVDERSTVMADVDKHFPAPRAERHVFVPVRLRTERGAVRAEAFAGGHGGSGFVASLPAVDGIAVLAPGTDAPVRVPVMLF